MRCSSRQQVPQVLVPLCQCVPLGHHAVAFRQSGQQHRPQRRGIIGQIVCRITVLAHRCAVYAGTDGVGIILVLWTRRQSRPSNSAANSRAESRMTPSFTAGQRNAPPSRLLPDQHQAAGVPDQDLDLSLRLEQNTSTTPEYGFSPSSAAASAAKPERPLRKSTGLVANSTRAPAGKVIMPPAPQPGAQPPPHRSRRRCAAHGHCAARPRSPRPSCRSPPVHSRAGSAKNPSRAAGARRLPAAPPVVASSEPADPRPAAASDAAGSHRPRAAAPLRTPSRQAPRPPTAAEPSPRACSSGEPRLEFTISTRSGAPVPATTFAISLAIAAPPRRPTSQRTSPAARRAQSRFRLPITWPHQVCSEHHVHEAGPASPHDGVAGWSVVRAGEIAAEAGDFHEVVR